MSECEEVQYFRYYVVDMAQRCVPAQASGAFTAAWGGADGLCNNCAERGSDVGCYMIAVDVADGCDRCNEVNDDAK